MFSQNTPPQHIGLNITKIGTASASPASGWNGCSYGMFRSVNGFWTEAIPIASDIKTSHLCCLSLALVFDTTSPSAGACAIGISSIGRPSEPRLASPRHGTLTPGRISVGRPPCLRLGLDGSIIVPDGIIAIQLATGCFVDGWTRLAPYLAVVDRGGSSRLAQPNKNV